MSPRSPPRQSSSTASAMASSRSRVAALLERPPALLDREQAPRHLDHRRAVEVLRESVGVDRRRGDDDLQVGPARQDLAQVAEQEVDVQAAFVRLVDDQRVVGAQQRVALRLGEQDAVGHQLDRGAALQPVLEAHLEADDLAERRVQLLGDALGDARRGDAPRLRVADQPAAAGTDAATQLERDLRQLGGLARAGLAADDDDRVLAHRPRDLVPPRRDRQRRRVGDRRDGVRGGDGLGRHGPPIIGGAVARLRASAFHLVRDGVDHGALRVLHHRHAADRRGCPSGPSAPCRRAWRTAWPSCRCRRR